MPPSVISNVEESKNSPGKYLSSEPLVQLFIDINKRLVTFNSLKKIII